MRVLECWDDIENYIIVRINKEIEKETLTDYTIFDLINGTEIFTEHILENFERFYIDGQDAAEQGVALCDWCVFHFHLDDTEIEKCREYLYLHLDRNDKIIKNAFETEPENNWKRYLMIQAVWNKYKKEVIG